MRHSSLIVAPIFGGLLFLSLSIVAVAQEPRAYQEARLLQMESVDCGKPRAGANDGAGRLPLCQEYTLQADRVIYRVRSKSSKHAVLLPVGERVRFRMEKNKFLIRAEADNSSEHAFTLMTVTPASETTVDARPVHLNHLQ
ncbi:MAG: hypothetical protein WCC95_02730 [Candidatus Sulfotelmatobacter sp.]|jgi:hypothetical protein